MSRRLSGTLSLCLAILAVGAAATGQPLPGKLRAATRVVEPFVMQDGDRLAGFSVDLWHAIADRLKVDTEMQPHPGVKDLLAAVKAGKADVGIAAVSITEAREREFDFSQPMFEAGLQILTPLEHGRGGEVADILKALFVQGVPVLVGLSIIGVLLLGHLVWLVERGNPDGMVPRGYRQGIGKAIWWAGGTLATQADEMPKGCLGRMLAIFWMFTSVLFVAYFTAQVTTSLTVEQLHGTIKGPADLPGKRVATTRGSTSEEYLKEHRIESVLFADIHEAFDALSAGKADAVVFDSPVLMYYASHDGQGKVQVVGSPFRKESYGIAFRNGSPYRKPVNRALLGLQEDGTYQELYDKWFGTH